MRLINHLIIFKFYKLTILRCIWNNSLGCTIFYKYHISKRIVKLRVPNISGAICRALVIATCGYQVTVEMKSSQLAPNYKAE